MSHATKVSRAAGCGWTAITKRPRILLLASLVGGAAAFEAQAQVANFVGRVIDLSAVGTNRPASNLPAEIYAGGPVEVSFPASPEPPVVSSPGHALYEQGWPAALTICGLTRPVSIGGYFDVGIPPYDAREYLNCYWGDWGLAGYLQLSWQGLDWLSSTDVPEVELALQPAWLDALPYRWGWYQWDANTQIRFSLGPAPVANAGPDRSVLAGPNRTATVLLDGTGSNSASGLNYTWYEGWTTDAWWATGIKASATLSVGRHRIRLVITKGDLSGGWGADETVITVMAPPLITSQPLTCMVVPGGNATFSVAASGAPDMFCQWLFNGKPLSGATNLNYSVRNAQPADAGAYLAVITNSLGATTSSVARLTIVLPPTLAISPGRTRRGQFQFSISSPQEIPVEIQTSSDFLRWVTAGTLTNTAGQSSFTQSETKVDCGFYRARLLP